MHKLYTIILFISFTSSALAQSTSSSIDNTLNDSLRSNDKLMVVVIVLATIFAAVSAYLIYQDIRLKKIEKEIHNSQTPK